MLRILAILLLCFVVVNLAWALFTLLKDKSSSMRTVKALTVRVGISLLLFLIIVVTAALDIFPSS